MKFKMVPLPAIIQRRKLRTREGEGTAQVPV